VDLNVKIRTKDGDVLDLAKARAWLQERQGPLLICDQLIVLNALEAVLSVRTEHDPPYPGVVDAINEVLDDHGDSEDIGDACYFAGRSSMRQAVRQAAGVVEEEPG
jgi:hypothetical protein